MKDEEPGQHAYRSNIPSPVRFILLVFCSLNLSSVLHTLTAEFTAGDLALVSKQLDEWWGVAGLLAWRAVELGLAWILEFDGKR
jgi:hypothetical protein